MAPLTLGAPVPDAVTEADKSQDLLVSQVVITLPPSPPTPPASASATYSTALDWAAAKLGRLREDLQGADPRLVAGRLELVSGWVHSEASVRAVLSQAMTASKEEKQVTS